MDTTQELIKEIVTSHPIVLFMKGTAQFPQCGFSGNAVNILRASGVEKLHTVNVLEDPAIRQGIKVNNSIVRHGFRFRGQCRPRVFVLTYKHPELCPPGFF